MSVQGPNSKDVTPIFAAEQKAIPTKNGYVSEKQFTEEKAHNVQRNCLKHALKRAAECSPCKQVIKDELDRISDMAATGNRP